MRSFDLFEDPRRHGAATGAVLLALCAAFLLRAAPAHAARNVLYVATNGTDNADCGPPDKSACRSISRAIAHANAGDQLVVGPGVYGDVNRDAVVNPAGDSGEESPVAITPIACGLFPTVSLAMIRIDKPLTIVSRDGAGSTVIDAGGQYRANYAAVDVAADGVVFGQRGKGFTVRNSTIGVNVGAGVASASVQGNTAECDAGFLVGSCGEDGGMATGTVLKGNSTAPDSVVGFFVADESAIVSGNLAKGSFFTGFALLGGSNVSITKNIAIDGLGTGFFLIASGGTPDFSRNAALGNNDAGVFIGSTGAVATAITIGNNSFFGNGKRPQYPPVNCGVVVQNSGAQTLSVDVDGNYWGAASGPGADPADSVGGTCSAGTVALHLAEWADKEIRVKPPTK